MIRLLAGAFSLVLLICQAQALYFYIDGPTQKCFFEELPKDTLVVGMDTTRYARELKTVTDSARFIQGHTMERAIPLLRREP